LDFVTPVYQSNVSNSVFCVVFIVKAETGKVLVYVMKT
jgi:hypothetical protein